MSRFSRRVRTAVTDLPPTPVAGPSRRDRAEGRLLHVTTAIAQLLDRWIGHLASDRTMPVDIPRSALALLVLARPLLARVPGRPHPPVLTRAASVDEIWAALSWTQWTLQHHGRSLDATFPVFAVLSECFPRSEGEV